MTLTIKGATTIKSLTTVGFYPGSLFAAGEQGVWYDPSDMTTMFQDVAGTTPVTAVEQSVGLLLDKRSPAYSVYFDGTGDYLTVQNTASVNNFGTGDFTIETWVRFNAVDSEQVIIACGSSWTANTAYLFEIRSTGDLRFYAGDAVPIFLTSGNLLVANIWYHVAVARSSGSTKMFVNGTQVGSTHTGNVTISNASTPYIGCFWDQTTPIAGYISNLRIVKGTALYTSNFTPTRTPLTPVSNTSLLTCGTSWSGNPTITVNGDAKANSLNPFGAATGNHAIQSSAGNRPVLSARVNLLTKTEQFDDAAWNKIRLTVSADNIMSPNGNIIADRLIENSQLDNRHVRQDVSSLVGQYTFSCYAKSAGRTFVALAWGTGGSKAALFDLTLGTVNYSTGCIASIANVGNDWYLVSISVVAANENYACIAPATSSTFNLFQYQGDGSSGIYVWGADLRPTNQGVNLPTYQRVNTSSDYDTTNFPMYLKFDGTNDSLATANVNFTSTDKVTAFSSVRKVNSGGSFGVIFEVSTYLPDNVGTFNMAAPGGLAGSTENYSSTVRGSSAFVGYDAVTFTSPITNVLSTSYDLSANTISQQVRPRVNGVIPTLNASGSSNAGMTIFGTYPIYIGARAGSSLYFNGNIYGLIIRGASSSNNQIQATESWLNQKTKAY